MKKLLLILAVIASFQLSAQKISKVSGSAKDLKGVSSLDVQFVYADNLQIGKITEEAYIAKHKADAEAKEVGAGDKWEKAYYADREEHFAPMFLELFNKYLEKKGMDARENNADAEFRMIVTTTFIEPGFNIGIQSRPAFINFEVSFINIKTGEEIAKYKVVKSPGTAMYDFGQRVGEAYAKGAKEFAKFLLKAKAF